MDDKTTRRLRLLFWVLLFAGVLGLVVFRLVLPRTVGVRQQSVASIRAEKGIPVKLYEVGEGPWTLWKSYYGRVRSATTQDVTSFVREYITSVAVEVGDRVNPGDVLMELSQETRAAFVSAKRADYLEVERNYQRKKALFEAGGISRQELNSAYVELENKRSQLSDLQSLLERTKVVARISGTVLERNAEVGEISEAGRVLLRIADLDDLEAEVMVPPIELGRVRKGSQVRLVMDGRLYPGVVERIDPEADSATGLYRAIVSLERGSDLRPGIYAEAQVLVDDRDRVVSVPVEVLRREGGEDFVFVVSGDVVEKRSVGVGGAQGGLVEIPSRLYVGERVVIEGVESLYDGARIWIQNDGEASGDARP